MKAIEVGRFGGSEVLVMTSAAEPAAGPGDVLVDVAAADTLWLETEVRSGRGGVYFPVTPPYRPGVGVAGTTPDGRRVLARLGHAGGGYAERVAVPVTFLHDIPGGVGFPEAAAVLHDGTTAMALMDVVKVVAGDRVLVTAAAGGMGALLVQLAKAAGATVVAAVGGTAKSAAIATLGPDVVVDYTRADWTDEVWEATGGLDVVLDGAGGAYGRAAFDLVVDGGRFSAHGMPAGGFATVDAASARSKGVTATDITAVQLDPARYRAYLAAALREVAAARLRPLIGQTFPLSAASAAHAAIESRTAVGKTLLLP